MVGYLACCLFPQFPTTASSILALDYALHVVAGLLMTVTTAMEEGQGGRVRNRGMGAGFTCSWGPHPSGLSSLVSLMLVLWEVSADP